MKSIEDQCREICLTGGYDPDGIAAQEWQDMLFGYPLGPDGLVRVWMTWITTIEASEKRDNNPHKPHDPEKKKRQAYIARMIEESNPGQDPRYKYHTQKY